MFIILAAATPVGDVMFTAHEVAALVLGLVTIIGTGLGAAKMLIKWDEKRSEALKKSLSAELGNVSGDFDAFTAETRAALDQAQHGWQRVERKIADLVTRTELESARDRIVDLDRRLVALETARDIEANGPTSGRHPAG
jgi:hypothetical protein